MSDRRFQAGQEYTISGLQFRVVAGKKGPDDLRLEVMNDAGNYRPVLMSLGLFLADFFGENEDYLYPPPGAGGDYYISECWRARRQGWEEAALHLVRQKAAKRAREREGE
jgi:hypothetical protein